MQGPDVHVTGHGPGPATDQWSCDCGQQYQKVLSLHLCPESECPAEPLEISAMISRKEEEWWSMGLVGG